MTYDLYIGDKTYSSWSLRGWLMFRKFGIPFRPHTVRLFDGSLAEGLSSISPARLVPAMKMPDGTIVGESLAMAETLADRHPDAGLWPDAPAQKATARWLVAEMCAGFGPLRAECPMQFLRIYKGFDPSAAVLQNLSRIETLWAHARAISGSDKGWVFGDYSLADVFYTPVAARIIGYDLPVSTQSRVYAQALLDDPAVIEWRKDALGETFTSDPYPIDLPSDPWSV